MFWKEQSLWLPLSSLGLGLGLESLTCKYNCKEKEWKWKWTTVKRWLSKCGLELESCAHKSKLFCSIMFFFVTCLNKKRHLLHLVTCRRLKSHRKWNQSTVQATLNRCCSNRWEWSQQKPPSTHLPQRYASSLFWHLAADFTHFEIIRWSFSTSRLQPVRRRYINPWRLCVNSSEGFRRDLNRVWGKWSVYKSKNILYLTALSNFQMHNSWNNKTWRDTSR